MTTTITLEPGQHITIESTAEKISFDPAISHIGLPGNQHGLCGTRTLGIPAPHPAATCPECHRLWKAKTWLQRRLYRGQP